MSLDLGDQNRWDYFVKRGKFMATLAGVSAGVGLMVGVVGTTVHLGDTRPDPVVRVKEVPGPERVVYKTKTETKTVTEVGPLPDSCETITDMSKIVLDYSAKVNKDATDVKLAVGHVTGDILRDPMAVNRIEVELQRLKIKLDDHLLPALNSNQSLAYQLEICRNDIEASNDGDDVAPLDGEPAVTP